MSCGPCRKSTSTASCYKPTPKELKSSVPIVYFNKTNCVDFDVIVFTQGESTHTVRSPYVAWQVLRGQSSVTFLYPKDVQVGATYQQQDQMVTAGPFCTEEGSTWEIVQNKISDTAEIQEVIGMPRNDEGVIVIQNAVPSTWSGRKFNVGIYKNNKLFITQNDVHVGDRVHIKVKPVLYFAVSRNFDIGEKFMTFEVMTHVEMFDLTKFPNGMQITLTEQPAGGKYKFTATNNVLNKTYSFQQDNM